FIANKLVCCISRNDGSGVYSSLSPNLQPTYWSRIGVHFESFAGNTNAIGRGTRVFQMVVCPSTISNKQMFHYQVGNWDGATIKHEQTIAIHHILVLDEIEINSFCSRCAVGSTNSNMTINNSNVLKT